MKARGVTSGATEAAYTQDPSRLIALGTAYLLALSVVARREKITLMFVRRIWVYMLFLGFILMSLIWATYPIKVVINWGHYVGISVVALSAVYYFRDRPSQIYALITICTVFIASISILVSIMMPKIGIHGYTGRWQGLTGNPNTFGLVCALGVWGGIFGLLMSRWGSSRYILYLMGLCISVIGLVGSRSATSITVSAMIGVSAPILLSMRNDGKAKKRAKIVILIWAVVATISCLYAFAPEWLKLDSMFLFLGKDITLTGRTELWEMAIEVYRERPYLGWGYDSLASVLSRNDLETGQFHSGYLDLLVRGGIISIIFLVFFLARIFVLIRRYARAEYAVATSFFVLAVSIMVHNLVEASFVRVVHYYWVMLVFIYFYLEYVELENKLIPRSRAENKSASN